MVGKRPMVMAWRGLAVAACMLLASGCYKESSVLADAVAAPTNLTAIPSDATVTLSWAGSSQALGYRINRATSASGTFTQIASTGSQSYTDSGVSNGTTYVYVVSSFDSGGASADSTPAMATPVASTALPAAPTGVMAVGGNAQVVLSWSASSGASSYNVKRATTSGGPFTQVATGTSLSWTDSAVTNGTAYFYVVSALNAQGESGNSTQVNATPAAAVSVPASPAGLTAISGNAVANLSWPASSGATSYNVKRSSVSGGPYTKIATATATSYSDATVINNLSYFYVVSAANSVGESTNSMQASASPTAPNTVPAAPTGLTAISEDAKVTLSWVASTGATSYIVKRSLTNGGSYTQVSTTMTPTYVDAAVSNGTPYYYVVAAANAVGTSANSVQAMGAPVAAGTLPTVNCSSLGAVGVWQKVTPPGYNADYRAAAFVVDKNTGVVYLGSDSFNDGHSLGVQRSADCGNTWQHVSTGSGSDAINGGRQWTFRIDTDDGRILYTNSGYYSLGLWKSYNGGVDWTDITPKNDGAPGFIGYLQMDRDDPKHILVSWHAPCNGRNNEFKYEDQVGCFHETKDGGRTWKAHYSTTNKWPNEVRPLLLHGSTWLVLADTVLRTSDGGATYASVGGGSLSGHSSGFLSISSTGDFYIGSQPGIYRSTKASDGREWTYVGGTWAAEMVDTGKTMYQMQIGGGGPMLTSASADGVNWSVAPEGSPTMCERTQFDPLHKVLYLSCGPGGFYRMLVP